MKNHDSAPNLENNPWSRRNKLAAAAGAVVLTVAAIAAGSAVASAHNDGSRAASWTDRQHKFAAEGYTPIASGTGDETVDLTTDLEHTTAPVALAYSGDDPKVSFRIGQGTGGSHTLDEYSGGGSSIAVPGGLTASEVTVFGAEPGTEWTLYQVPTDTSE